MSESIELNGAHAENEPLKAPGKNESLKACDDEPMKSPSKDAPQNAAEKRKPRLNRRSFHLLNNPIADISIEKPKPNVEVKTSIGLNQSKTDCPQKKVISLVSMRKNAVNVNPVKEKKIILLKGNSSITDVKKKAETSVTSTEGPPQKKHKVITWP